MRALLLSLLLVGACAAHPPTPPPAPAQAPAPTAEPHVYVEPLEFVAPPCTDAGPSVKIVSHRDGSGGHGDLSVHTDQRIRNPTDRPLWLFIDATNFPGDLNEVYLERRWHEAPFVVWAFYAGNDGDTEVAVRLAPGTDVVARSIDYVQWGNERRPIREAFVDRIDIDSDEPPWPPSLGVLPTHGDLDTDGLNGFFGYELDERVRAAEVRPVSIHTVCVQTTAVADLMGN
jgi:hypothetical protein